MNKGINNNILIYLEVVIMKKTLLILLSLAVCFVGQACSSSEESLSPKEKQDAELKRLLDEDLKKSRENGPLKPKDVRFKAPSPMPF